MTQPTEMADDGNIPGTKEASALDEEPSESANMNLNPEPENVPVPKFSLKDQSCGEFMKSLRDYITVEPLLICYIMPSVLAILAVQNMHLQKACRVNLNYTEEVCTALDEQKTDNYTEENDAVQTLVADMTAWKTALQSSVPAILVLFLGSWSDRHRRRKPFMLLPITGECITSIGFMLCTYYYLEWSMEITGVIEALFPALTGGSMTMLMAIFSHIADVTSVEMRTFRIGVVNIVLSLVVPIGTALSGVLYKLIGLYGLFIISVVFYVCGIFYGYIFIHEAKKPIPVEKNLCLDFFDPRHAIDAFKLVLKRREGRKQQLVIYVLLIFCVVLGPTYGESTVSYYYARYRFKWDEVDYSFYATYGVIINLVGTIIAITVFSRWLQLDDTIIGILACCSKIAASFVYALSPNSTIFYIAPLVDVISGTGIIAIRSISTKIVESDEQGKINSLFGICEAIVPLIYNPMYSSLYVKTLKTLPGAFYLLGAFLTFPAILIFAWMYVLQRRDKKQVVNTELDEKTDNFRYTAQKTE